MKVQILTQQNCPKCVSLKAYLDKGLGGRYNDQIDWVKREERPDEFIKLAQEHAVMSTPALVYGEEVIRDPNPGNVQEFFKAL